MKQTRKRAHHPPQQARSRETLRRMLDAAEHVLEKHGPDGATLARVARQAKLSPASVYRRFRDKDALMAAVFSRFSEVNAQELERKVDEDELRKIGIRNFARNWISALINGYRTRTGLIRAAVQYSQQHENAPFVRKQRSLEVANFRKMVGMFLLWRDEIRHPSPEYAVSYAMIMVAFALRELILFDQARTFGELTPVDDAHLREELPRAFLRYLGVAED